VTVPNFVWRLPAFVLKLKCTAAEKQQRLHSFFVSSQDNTILFETKARTMGGLFPGSFYATFRLYYIYIWVMCHQPVLIKRSIAAPRAPPSSRDFSGLRAVRKCRDPSLPSNIAPKYALCSSGKYMNIVLFKRKEKALREDFKSWGAVGKTKESCGEWRKQLLSCWVDLAIFLIWKLRKTFKNL